MNLVAGSKKKKSESFADVVRHAHIKTPDVLPKISTLIRTAWSSFDSTPTRRSKIRVARESPALLAMTEHRGVPGVAGDVRAPRSEESPMSLVMTEHQGVPNVGSDVRAPRSP